MIVSENIKLKLTKPVNSGQIETALKKKGITPLRWAVIEAGDDTYTISTSYVKNILQL